MSLSRSARRPLALFIVTALGVLAPAGLCSAAALETTDTEPLSRFGPHGDLRPVVGDALMAEDFFERDLGPAAASREYHSAVWRLPTEQRVRDRQDPRHAQDLEDGESRRTWTILPNRIEDLSLELVAGDRSGSYDDTEAVDITVSVRHETGSRNYLVRLDGTPVRLQVPLQDSDFGPTRSLMLLSFSPFEATVRTQGLLASNGLLVSEGIQARAEILTVLAPDPSLTAAAQSPTKSVDYCQARNAYLKITNAGGYYVIAYGRRIPAPGTAGVDYLLDVEYPAGSAFHIGTGGSQLAWDPPCKNYQTWTRRADYSKAHIWQGMDDLMFHCSGIGTATCIQGCPEWEMFDVQLTGPSLGLCF